MDSQVYTLFEIKPVLSRQKTPFMKSKTRIVQVPVSCRNLAHYFYDAKQLGAGA